MTSSQGVRVTAADLGSATAAAVGTFLLFADFGPTPGSPRSFQHAWNLGHILLFYLLTRGLLRHDLDARDWPLAAKAGTVLLGCLALGVFSEWVQATMTLRSASPLDVMNDVSGGLLALTLSSRSVHAAKPLWRWGMSMLSAGLVAAALWPVAASLLDEYRARRDFPLLSGLEYRSELSRWSSATAALAVTGERYRSGARALRLDLTTARYSGVSLRYFPADWRAWRFLRFSLYRQPGAGPERVTCRVHDRRHEGTDMHYRDRFNRDLLLHEGWNDVEIALRDIEHAPRGRSLDLSGIAAIGIFATRLESPAVLWIDDVRLE